MIYLCSPVAVIEKRLMDVKLCELVNWIGGRDFTPNGMIAAIRRGKGTKINRTKLIKRLTMRKRIFEDAAFLVGLFCCVFQAGTGTTTSTST